MPGAQEKPNDMLNMSDDEFNNLSAPPAFGSDTSSSSTTEEIQEPENNQLNSENDKSTQDSNVPDEQSRFGGENQEHQLEAPGSTDSTENPGNPLAQEDDKLSTYDPRITADSDKKREVLTPKKDESNQDSKAENTDKVDSAKPDKPAINPNQNQTQYAFQAFKPEEKASAFDQIMAPFKANGKMIELRSPEEAIQLMQMGANYTKKLQELQPQKKLIMMLEKNDLLDERKLSFLIDLDKGDPEAIQKLIKDSGIDPLEIDAEKESEYLPQNNFPSDNEVKFREALDDLSTSEQGVETLQIVNAEWDDSSKRTLFDNPEYLSIIHSQRESGIYDLVKNEVERQISFGNIPAGTPFIEAYKAVGDYMAHQALNPQNGNTNQNGNVAPVNSEPPRIQNNNLTRSSAPTEILGTKVVTPQSQIDNNEQAKAAAPSKGSIPKASQFINPLAESDEEFLKRFENRL